MSVNRKSPALTDLTQACGALGGAFVGSANAQVDRLHTNTQCSLGKLGPLDQLVQSLYTEIRAPCALYKRFILN